MLRQSYYCFKPWEQGNSSKISQDLPSAWVQRQIAAKMKRVKGDLISSNFAQGRKTFIIPLTFPDITVAKGDLERISYGGDVWQLRVDLLQLPQSQTAIPIPPREYVGLQLKFLQQSTNLPIIFAIRTVSQGGNFPDEAFEEALELMLLAIDQGCDYIDIGASWPPQLIQEVERQKQGSKIIASFHHTIGVDKWIDVWHSKHAQLNDFGGIIEFQSKFLVLTPNRYSPFQYSVYRY